MARGDTVLAKGSDEQLDQVQRVFMQLRQLLRHHGQLTTESVRTVLEVVQQGGDRLETTTPPAEGKKAESVSSRYLRPRTDGQARYVRAMRDNDLTLCIGPAGTGKTYLAVGMAVSMLRAGQVKKIVLVRPAVEAGERLGFLPGDIVAKVNPYLRPLFDSLNDMMEPDAGQALHGQRHHRDRAAGLHARPDPEPGRHHSRRGPEHDRAADEDVPDAHGQGLEDHRHRRRDAGRPAPADAQRSDRRRPPPARRRAELPLSTWTKTTLSATRWCSGSCAPTRTIGRARRRSKTGIRDRGLGIRRRHVTVSGFPKSPFPNPRSPRMLGSAKKQPRLGQWDGRRHSSRHGAPLLARLTQPLGPAAIVARSW